MGRRRTQTHVGPLSFVEAVLLGVSKVILLFGRISDETKEGRTGKNWDFDSRRAKVVDYRHSVVCCCCLFVTRPKG